jgi:hypothetical protein
MTQVLSRQRDASPLHAGPFPQRHPPLEQLSAELGLQGLPVPQRHPPLEQLSAVAALQTVHWSRPVSHADSVLPGRQSLPEQQPAHVFGSHSQVLPLQR